MGPLVSARPRVLLDGSWGELAAEHFLERGFRSIGFVLQESSYWEGSREEATYRGLQRRVHEAGGTCLTQELLRKRLERCRELLLTSDLTVTDIAPQIGFLSKNYLHRAFRKQHGMSPTEFRRKRRSD